MAGLHNATKSVCSTYFILFLEHIRGLSTETSHIFITSISRIMTQNKNIILNYTWAHKKT